jgi:hypothetical protein
MKRTQKCERISVALLEFVSLMRECPRLRRPIRRLTGAPLLEAMKAPDQRTGQ